MRLILAATLSCSLGVSTLHAADPNVVENSNRGLWDEEPRRNVHLLEDLILGSADGEDAFGRLRDVAIDSRGRWFILDAGLVTVHVYDPDSLIMRRMGRKGEGPGDFNQPTALGIDAMDNVYVASTGGRIAVFGPGGNLVDEFRHKVQSAFVADLKFTPNGAYIACFDAMECKVVHRYDATHGFLSSFSDSWSAVKAMPRDEEFAWNGGAIDVDAEGCVYYTQATPYEIRKFSPQGELLLTIHRKNDFKPPRVERRSNGATFYSFSSSTGIFALPEGKIMNVANHVRVDTDAGSTRTVIDVFDADGRLLKSRELKRVVSIRCFDASGRLYAIEEREVPQVVKYRLVFQ